MPQGIRGNPVRRRSGSVSAKSFTFIGKRFCFLIIFDFLQSFHCPDVIRGDAQSLLKEPPYPRPKAQCRHLRYSQLVQTTEASLFGPPIHLKLLFCQKNSNPRRLCKLVRSSFRDNVRNGSSDSFTLFRSFSLSLTR